MSAVSDVLADLSTFLEERGIDWYVFGAQAVVVFGRPRQTLDVDVTIDVSLYDASELSAALEQAGFPARVEDIETFVGRTRVMPVVHKASGIPVDMILAGPGEICPDISSTGEPKRRSPVEAPMDTTRTAIIEATVDAYVEDPEHLAPEAVCARAGVDPALFERHFSDINDVIRAWYPYAVDLVTDESAAIPELANLPLQDRLGTFCFMLLDVLESRTEFVKATFLFQAAGFCTPFHRRLREGLKSVLRAVDIPGVNYFVVDSDATRFAIAESIVQMIGVWLKDESPDRARATALIDLILALHAEIMTNRIPERALDLFRYAMEAGYLPLDRLPLVGTLFRKDLPTE